MPRPWIARAVIKAGPYSEGSHPGGGQYGLLTIDDGGGDVTIGLSGRDYTGAELVGYTLHDPRRRASAVTPPRRSARFRPR